MKLNELDIEIAEKIMELWEQHLGFSGNHPFRESPRMMVFSYHEMKFSGIDFMVKIGSIYNDNSKLRIYEIENSLCAECDIGIDSIYARDLEKKALASQEKFNSAIIEYINGISGNS
ncbi:MAG: hypothetical protein ACLFUO_03950 [Candidatus Woesearchaeota archaeon]